MNDKKLFQPPGTFVKHLIDTGFERHRGVVREEQFEIHSLDLTSLKVHSSLFTPFVIAASLSGKTMVPADDVIELLDEIRKLPLNQPQVNFTVFVIGGLLVQPNARLWKLLRNHSIALLDRERIDAVFAAHSTEAKSQALCAGLVKSLGCEALSPYLVNRPAYGSRFFGRSRLLQKVPPTRRGGSFTIIGNRRIGKTSLLREIRHRLFLNDPQMRQADLYVSKFNSTEEVLETILDKVESSPKGPRPSGRELINKFPSRIHALPDSQGKQVAIFMDEVDRVLEFDELQNWELMEVLRATFLDHPGCWIFFAGFRRTRQAKMRKDTSLHNFGEMLEVERFTRDETIDMIVRPLRRLGLDLVNSDLPLAIYRETGGQPELVQIFGKEIVSHLEKHCKGPDTTELLTQVMEGDDFKDRVKGTFRLNTAPFEELACYLLMDFASRQRRVMEEFEFSVKEVGSLLREKSFRLDMGELDTLVRNLEISGVIAAVPGVANQYQFSVPQLARYCLNEDLEMSIESALEKVEYAPDRASALLDSPIDDHEE